MITLKLKSVVPLLLLGFVVFQLFGGVVLDVTAQETTPGIPLPPYIEPTPVREDIKPGGQILQGDALDASSVSTLILSSGEASIHGLIYYDGFLWASTRTAPGKVIKINPASEPMSVAGSATFGSNRNNAEDIVAANNYIWTVASETDGTTPTGQAYLVRVDPATLALQYTQFYVNSSSYLLLAESIKYAHGKLWVGGLNGIAEVDISNPGSPSYQIHNTTGLAEEDYAWATALTSDATHLWAVFTQVDYIGNTGFLIGSTFTRIDPSDLSNPDSYTKLYIPTELFPDDMIYANGYLYTSSENSGLPSLVYQFPPDLIYSTQLASTAGISYGTFFNPLDPYTFWGSYTSSPGKLIKFDFNMNNLWEVDLPATPTPFEDPSEIAFDESGNMYVSTFTSPARLVKYTAPEAVTVSIAKSGNDAVLTWNNSDPLVERFEIWRSTDPYFTPQGAVPHDTLTAATGENTYTDVSAIGDVNNNYFYVVRAFNDFGLISPISNRVGEFDFSILRDRYNTIAIPLSDPTIITADNLGNAIGATTVSRWVPSTQSLSTRIVGFSGVNFVLATGRGYFVYTPGLGPTILSIVGNVPPAGSVSFTIARGTTNCLLNLLTLPLDQPGLTTADAMANSIGGVPVISRWGASTGGFTTRIVGFSGVNFATRIGYPYWPCAETTGGGPTWP